MATISGVISEIRARPTRFGDMYDVHVNGTAYGHGKYPPRGFVAGDFVTFDFEEKPNGQYINRNIVAKSLRKETNLPAPPSTSVAAENTKQTSYTARVPVVDKRQETISKQSAMNTALTLLSLQLQHGAIKLPAKAPDVYTLINTMLAETAARVYEANTGETWNLTGDDFSKPVAKPAASEEFIEDAMPDFQ